MRRSLRVLAALGGLVVLLALTALGLVGTQAGSAWLVRQAAPLAAAQIGAVDGTLLDRLVVRDLIVTDNAGAWLRAERLELAWRPLAAVSGLLHVEQVQLDALQILRAPAGPPNAAAQPATVPDLSWLWRLRVGQLAVNGTAPVAGVPTAFTLAGSFDGPGGVATLTAERPDSTGAVAVQAQLSEQELRLAVNGHEPDGALLTSLAGLPGAPGWRLQLNGAGPLQQWSGALTASLAQYGDVTLDVAIADRAVLSVEGRVRLDPAQAQAIRYAGPEIDLAGEIRRDGPALLVERLRLRADRGRLSTHGRVSETAMDLVVSANLAVADLAPVALRPVLGEAVNVNVEGRWQWTENSIRIDRLTAAGAGFGLEGRGQLTDLASRRGEAALSLRLSDLGLLAPAAGGALVVHLDARNGATATAKLEAQGQDLRTGIAAADALLGSAPRVQAKLGFDGAQVTVAAATLRGAALAADLQGGWTLADNSLRGAVEVAVARLGAVLDGASGALRLDAGIAGTLAAPRIEGTVRGAELGYAGVPVTAFSSSVAATLAEVRFSDLAASAAGVVLSGEGGVAFATGLPEARLAFLLADATALSRVAGLDVSGVLQGEARVSASNGRLAATVNATGRGLAAAGVVADSVNLDASAPDLLSAPRARYRLQAEGVTAGGFAWRSVTAEGAAGAKQGEVRLRAEGERSVAATAGFDRSAAATTLSIEELRVVGAGQTLALRHPATVRVAPTLAAADVQLALNGAPLSFSYTQGAPVRATLRGRDLPLQALQLLSPALAVDGRADVAASITGAAGQATVRVRDVRASPEGPALALDAEAQIADGRLTVSGLASGLGPQPARLRLALPARLDTRGMPQVAPDAALDGGLTWQGSIAPLVALLPLDVHRLTGTADVDVTVGGTLAAPELRGGVRLTEGRYENVEWGTLLTGLALTATTADSQTLAVSLAAQAGDGRIGAAGEVRNLLGGAPEGRLDVTLEQAALLRRDDVQATASGGLQFAGGLERGRLAGQLRADQVEYRLGGGPAARVPQLNVVEAGARPAPAPEPAAPALGGGIDLALVIDLAKSVFVRGMGLDSQWDGRIEVGGTVAEPAIGGVATAQRGTLELLGKTFTVASGEVRLAPAAPDNPTIAFRAEHKTSDITAALVASGTAQQPAISLESTPALPPDEIMARVLFGRGLSQIAPGQAIALARAAAQLGGVGGVGGGGPDTLGQLRGALGLDTLSIGGEGGPTLEAGRRIGDRIYLGVEQGVDAKSGSVNVEVELTPSITLESRTNQRSGADIGLNWKRDY